MYNFLILISALATCFAVNPIQSLLWLIVTFVVGAMFMLQLGAEFLAILIVLVYIGAIAVLFLFVVMLLNIRKVELYPLIINYFPIGIFIVLLLMGGWLLVIESFFIEVVLYDDVIFWINYLNFTSNIEMLSFVLFIFYGHYFILLSCILLSALLGVVVLVKE